MGTASASVRGSILRNQYYHGAPRMSNLEQTAAPRRVTLRLNTRGVKDYEAAEIGQVAVG